MKKINLYFIYGFIALLGFGALSSCTSDKEEERPSVTKLEIVQLPAKTVYGIGEKLDLTGMIVRKTYSDGRTENTSVSPSEVSGFDSSKAVKSQTLTVKIGEASVTFTIEVVSSLSVKKLPAKTIYALGDDLDLTGIEVVEVFGGGTEAVVPVTASNVSGFSSAKASTDLVLTVSVGGKTAAFSVMVMPVIIEDGVLTSVTEELPVIYLPSEVKSVAKSAFYYSTVTKVVLNEGLESISEDAFFESKIREVVFPSTLTTIGPAAFYSCSDLQELDLSNTKLTELAENLFGYSGLKGVKLPSTIKSVLAQAFTNTSNLQSVTLNEGVEFIGNEAFRASGVVTVNVPNSVRTMEERAFYKCPNLREINAYGAVPSGTTSQAAPTIQMQCFAENVNLVKLDIPMGVENIDEFVLNNGLGVQELTLSANIKNLEFSVFRNSGLSRVTVHAAVPPVADISRGGWLGFPSNIVTIKVPASSVVAYKVADGWSEYADKIVAE